jgi:hypothetical protein
MSVAEKYIREGHPTVAELVVEQGVVFPRDPNELLGDFWPEEESIDDFLRCAAYHAKCERLRRRSHFEGD